ncbi:MAG: hypothetical protein ACYTGH_19120, partial [Planctomycetota bacterium]
RINLNVTAWPIDTEENISEFAVVFNATVPQPYRGHLDAYTLHFGANKNTRTYLARNDTEVATSRYVALEPGVQYRLTITHTDREIRVLLNRQLIISYRDRDPLGGERCGFLHKGEGIHFSRVRIHTRGQSTRVASIEIPEALMEEECYSGAERHFMAIARAHANRFEGAWARYRAGMAAYLQSKDRQRAYRLWTPLRRSPFAIFEQLGRASIELEEGKQLKAAGIIRDMLEESENIPHLDAEADIVFNQTQLLLRQEQTGKQHWKKLDAWARLALNLGMRVDSKKEITPSLLWRWLLMALTEYPDQLEECILFMRETFGKDKGVFNEILTTIDPLMTILKRSADMTDHAYLMNKVMRLILNYDDNLGNLQTLARFYLHSGHEAMAEMISHHIYHFCRKNNYALPPMPITLLAVLSWLRGEGKRSVDFLQAMMSNSYDFATFDAHLLLGLFALEQDDRRTATQYWQVVAGKSGAVESNRHLVAQGLLGLLPPDAKAAGVPKRSDHQLLYNLFLGWKFFLEWKRSSDFSTRQTAIDLLTNVVELQRPSYDVYSATDTFVRIPLEIMGYNLPAKPRPEELSAAERKWVSELTIAASQKEEEEKEAQPTIKARKAKQPKKESGVHKDPGKPR